MPFQFKECFNTLIDIYLRQGDLQEAAEEKAREKEDLMISQIKMDLKNVSGKKTLDHSMYPQIILYKNQTRTFDMLINSIGRRKAINN